MNCLSGFAVLLSMLVGADASNPTEMAASRMIVHEEDRQRYITIEREGLPPVILPASNDILARDALKGTWRVTYLEHEGTPRPDLAGGMMLRFTRGKLELMQCGRPTKTVRYELNRKFYPPRFTWIDQCGGCLFLQRGVYWQEGDSVLLCLSAINARGATKFLTEPHDGRTLYMLHRIEQPDDGVASSEWLPLGVFSLAKGDDKAARMIVKLSVSQQGLVTGNAYDFTTQKRLPIDGTVDRKEENVTWTIGGAKPMMMTTKLESLTSTASRVSVREGEGPAEVWTLRYMFSPPR